MRRLDLSKFVRLYLSLGALWCLMTNLMAGLTGATSPVMAAAGASAGLGRAWAVAVGIVRQILLWPLELWERMIQPLFG